MTITSKPESTLTREQWEKISVLAGRHPEQVEIRTVPEGVFLVVRVEDGLATEWYAYEIDRSGYTVQVGTRRSLAGIVTGQGVIKHKEYMTKWVRGQAVEAVE